MSLAVQINRRYFFLGALALLPGCTQRRVRRNPQTHVSVLTAADYAVDLESRIRRILVEHRVNVSGKRVLLKPNLVEFSSERPINTNPVFVRAVADAFRNRGAAEVIIAEGPGHRRTTLDLAEAAGYFAAIPRFESRFTDLNVDDIRRIRVPTPFSTLRELFLPKTVFSADLVVSIPKMKTHHWTGATLSMKNLFGLVPGAVYGWPKNILHWAGINECVADLHQLFPNQFCIVDGIEAMEGNGPILGSAVNAGLIVAGSHPPSVDATCCRLMHLDANAVGYLRLIAQRTGWRSTDIVQIGERPDMLARPFRLLPELSHYRLRV